MVGSMVTIIHLCYGLCESISCSSCWKARTPLQSVLQDNPWKCKKCSLSFAPPPPPDWTIHLLTPPLDTCKSCAFIIFLFMSNLAEVSFSTPWYLNNLISSQASTGLGLFPILIWYGTHKFTTFLCCYSKTIQYFKSAQPTLTPHPSWLPPQPWQQN